ncbi:hypothetical protein PAEPH01_2475, partial [Pancytospora epiphaga]
YVFIGSAILYVFGWSSWYREECRPHEVCQLCEMSLWIQRIVYSHGTNWYGCLECWGSDSPFTPEILCKFPNNFHTSVKYVIFQPGQARFQPLNKETAEQLFNMLRLLRVLIIDEISLVTSVLLAQIDQRLQEIFGCDKPFGGISIVVFGDLLQLPPVPSQPVAGDKSGAQRSVPEYIFSCELIFEKLYY